MEQLLSEKMETGSACKNRR